VLDRFWEGVGNQFGERFVLRALGPALVFWVGLFLAYHRLWLTKVAPPVAATAASGESLDVWHAFGIPLSDTWLIFGAIAGILVTATSASMIEPLVRPVLRALEGYWLPRGPIRAWLVERHVARRRALDGRWRDLASLGVERLSGSERDDYAKVDLELRLIPSDPALVMPTRLGNILRTAERRPEARYGLSPMVCWTHLWLVLPSDARAELTEARERLDNVVRALIFAVLFAVFGCGAIWPIFVGAIAALVAYPLTFAPAEVYGDMLFAVFTLYRTSLYRSLRWPAPESPRDERACGEQLTQYLFRGGATLPVRFTAASDAAGAPEDAKV
jgi:hypothetical protein